MKLLSTFSLLILFALVAFTQGEDKYIINSKISSVQWVGKKVTGSHEGTIQLKDGSILMENGKITSGTITIDMTTIEVTDIDNAEMNAKLKGHLVSPDFFGTEKHPTGKLKINEVKQDEENTYTLYANLTLKNITEKIQIPATILKEEGKIVAIGEVEIDRTKYDIKYGSGSFFDNLGDKAISNNFTVKFKVAAMKR